MNVQHDTKHAVILNEVKDPKSGDDHLNYRV